ncbi:MAG: UDP-N-acetylglucosamine 1-carboxyvinyltransferase [Alphaproteobacteria bacterium]|nr:UDP-N-acetylglucosamine 1-carboxyvinyltransferase [Alphaproteobacteria bacterium SS10]
MDQIRIEGGRPLNGTIKISGAKNAALPLMAATLLSDKPLALTNVPDLADIRTCADLLAHLGVKVDRPGDSQITLTSNGPKDLEAPYDLVRKMRASILVLGPMVARYGAARVSLPGGCAIGNRPVDLHLSGLEKLGAEIELAGGYVEAKAPNGLIGSDVVFPKVSVGATENLMMAAALAKGQSRLINAAREPEITDLAECLNAMGANISGAGTDIITIEGVESLGAATHPVIADRVETGTYAMAAAITGGDLTLEGGDAKHLGAVIATMAKAEIAVEEVEGGLRVHRQNGRILGVDVMTEPFPGFPTDMQAQLMALMTRCEGAAMLTETIFENRFMHVPELARMGANITVHGASALIRGVPKLIGAPVMATDLRASVSLVLAGLAAEGETTINRVYHLDRGYEQLEAKLAQCGAVIERVQEAA